MSKTAWIIVGLVVLAIVGYAIFGGKKAPENVPVGSEQSQTPEKKMAFADFVRQGGSYKCDISQSSADTTNSGTVYVSGGMVKGEYSTSTAGRVVTTYFLVRDGFSYAWFSTDPTQGFKMKVDVTGPGADEWSSQIGDYNCVAWSADASVFAIPANVTFQEIEPK